MCNKSRVDGRESGDHGKNGWGQRHRMIFRGVGTVRLYLDKHKRKNQSHSLLLISRPKCTHTTRKNKDNYKQQLKVSNKYIFFI